MTDKITIELLAFIGALIAVITPIIRLNGNITELTVLFRELKELVQEKTDKLDSRVTKHGDEIDRLKIDVKGHEERIRQLEK